MSIIHNAIDGIKESFKSSPERIQEVAHRMNKNAGGFNMGAYKREVSPKGKLELNIEEEGEAIQFLTKDTIPYHIFLIVLITIIKDFIIAIKSEKYGTPRSTYRTLWMMLGKINLKQYKIKILKRRSELFVLPTRCPKLSNYTNSVRDRAQLVYNFSNKLEDDIKMLQEIVDTFGSNFDLAHLMKTTTIDKYNELSPYMKKIVKVKNWINSESNIYEVVYEKFKPYYDFIYQRVAEENRQNVGREFI